MTASSSEDSIPEKEKGGGGVSPLRGLRFTTKPEMYISTPGSSNPGIMATHWNPILQTYCTDNSKYEDWLKTTFPKSEALILRAIELISRTVFRLGGLPTSISDSTDVHFDDKTGVSEIVGEPEVLLIWRKENRCWLNAVVSDSNIQIIKQGDFDAHVFPKPSLNQIDAIASVIANFVCIVYQEAATAEAVAAMEEVGHPSIHNDGLIHYENAEQEGHVPPPKIPALASKIASADTTINMIPSYPSAPLSSEADEFGRACLGVLGECVESPANSLLSSSSIATADNHKDAFSTILIDLIMRENPAPLELLIVDNPKFETIIKLIRTYAKMLPTITPEFRDSFVLNQLVVLGRFTVDDEDNNNKQRQTLLAESLYGAYRALRGMSIGRATLKNHVIPGLKRLREIGGMLLPEKRVKICMMMAVMEQLISPASARSILEKDNNPANTHVASSSTSGGKESLGGFFSGWR